MGQREFLQCSYSFDNRIPTLLVNDEVCPFSVLHFVFHVTRTTHFFLKYITVLNRPENGGWRDFPVS